MGKVLLAGGIYRTGSCMNHHQTFCIRSILSELSEPPRIASRQSVITQAHTSAQYILLVTETFFSNRWFPYTRKCNGNDKKGGRSSSLLWPKQTKPNRKIFFVSDLAEIWYASIRSQFHPPHQIWGQSEVVWIFKKNLFICKVYK